MKRLGWLLWLCVASPLAQAVSMADDSGRTVVLDKPPARIVTLAPSLTELVFAAGGGAAIVGTTSLSDYPVAALRIARIGDATRLDVERILALKPDLLVVWQRGNLGREIEQIAAAGVPLFQLDPRRLADVPRAIERLGVLLGHEDESRRNAAALRASLERLRVAHEGAAPVSVFYQVWQSPLLTLNGEHLISDVIALCGGRNVFADVLPLVPAVSVEAVVAVDPEAIVTAGEAGGRAAAWQRAPSSASLAPWRRHARMTAVRRGWLFTLNGDLISRPGPRIAQGAEAMCAALDEVRRERSGR
jgi:iron complex transport system substrate-binding protein